jgi:predicted MFS family arabinose efflux permease
VIGTPLGAWLGGTFGWRYAFALISVSSLFSALWLWRSLPCGIVPVALSRTAWWTTFSSPTLMLTVCVTMVSGAGQFVLFSYLAPYLKIHLGVTTADLGLLLLLYGVAGFTGNVFIARYIDRMGASKSVMLSLGLMALGLGIWSLGNSMGWIIVAFIPWGLGVFATNSAQQARLLHLSPSLASASIALNSSAIYAGQAIGAAVGGWLILQQGMTSLPWFSTLGLILSMGVSWQASRYAISHPLPHEPQVDG